MVNFLNAVPDTRCEGGGQGSASTRLVQGSISRRARRIDATIKRWPTRTSTLRLSIDLT